MYSVLGSVTDGDKPTGLVSTIPQQSLETGSPSEIPVCAAGTYGIFGIRKGVRKSDCLDFRTPNFRVNIINNSFPTGIPQMVSNYIVQSSTFGSQGSPARLPVLSSA